MKKYLLSGVMLVIFEIVAVTLWLTRDNLFYLFNFSYIGFSIALGVFLFAKGYPHARRVTQLLVGLYMLVYLGLICNENMDVDVTDNSRHRKNGTECILCFECAKSCPKDAL